MKTYLLIIVLVFSCCKTSKPIVEDIKNEQIIKECLLHNFTKTANYKNEIEQYISIYQDTIIELESVTTKTADYITLLELRSSERYLWIMSLSEDKIDSLLIDCVTPTKWIESTFVLDNCEIKMDIESFDKNGLPVSGRTDRIRVNNGNNFTKVQ